MSESAFPPKNFSGIAGRIGLEASGLVAFKKRRDAREEGSEHPARAHSLLQANGSALNRKGNHMSNVSHREMKRMVAPTRMARNGDDLHISKSRTR